MLRITSFLPHTLRELTHFVKMLDDMETVDFQKAFRVMLGEGGAVEIGARLEVEKLKGNLSILKAYYMNYWCGNHLEYSQQRLIENIEQANQKMEAVYKSIN